MSSNNCWKLEEAVELCIEIEKIAPEFGCHIALTGGCLYKIGERKDLDILFYRIRQIEKIDIDGLISALSNIGVVKVSGFGWCHKAKFGYKNIDIFFPEEQAGAEYVHETIDKDDLPILKDVDGVLF